MLLEYGVRLLALALTEFMASRRFAGLISPPSLACCITANLLAQYRLATYTWPETDGGSASPALIMSSTISPRPWPCARRLAQKFRPSVSGALPNTLL